jgi:hypothetical protein
VRQLHVRQAGRCAVLQCSTQACAANLLADTRSAASYEQYKQQQYKWQQYAPATLSTHSMDVLCMLPITACSPAGPGSLATAASCRGSEKQRGWGRGSTGG